MKTSNFSLSAYLTSRQTLYFLPTSLGNECSMCLDYVTVTGIFHAEQFQTKLISLGWNEKPQTNIDGHPQNYSLFNDSSKRIASLIRNEYQKNSWRIQTSNHINHKEKAILQQTTKLFEQPHFTRLDIAFNFVNYGSAVMMNNLYPLTKMEYSKIGDTIYLGSSKSRKSYKYYNKLKERKFRKAKLPNELKSWERLELTVRKDLIDSWKQEARLMLNCFKAPKLDASLHRNEIKYPVYAQLKDLDKHPDKWVYVKSSKTKSKYRKLIQNNQGYDATYSRDALQVLSKYESSMQKEIDDFIP